MNSTDNNDRGVEPMIMWLIRLIFGTLSQPPKCEHEWELIHEHELEKKSYSCNATVMFKHYECKKCLKGKTTEWFLGEHG